MTLNSPHDHFFRETFSRRDVATDFIRHYLPEQVAAQLDLTELHTVKGSFIDPDLREHFSDLLYRTRLLDGQDAYVYVLFEHKSYPDRLVALQLLRYMVQIWEQALRQNSPAQLPPIVPVVVYHGVDAWLVDTRFRGLFEDRPALAGYVPDFRYQLCDLSEYSDEEISGEVMLKVTLLILKHVFDSELGTRLPGILSLMRDLAQARSGLEYLETALRYLTVAADQLSDNDLAQAVEETFQQTGGALMTTIAQRWIEKGIEQGLEQGLERGLEQGFERGLKRAAHEALLDILTIRFATVPPSLAQAISRVSDTARLRWLRKEALTATSLEEFSGLLKGEEDSSLPLPGEM